MLSVFVAFFKRFWAFLRCRSQSKKSTVAPSGRIDEDRGQTQVSDGVGVNTASQENMDAYPHEPIQTDATKQISATATISDNETTSETTFREMLLSGEDVRGWVLKLRIPEHMPFIELPHALCAFGRHLHASSEGEQQTEDSVKSAILVFHEVLRHPSSDASQRMLALLELSYLRQDYFRWSREKRDLEYCVRYLKEAIMSTLVTEEQRIGYIRDLAVRMISHGYQRIHAPEYLDHAIRLYTEVMQFQGDHSVLESSRDNSAPAADAAPELSAPSFEKGTSRTHLSYTLDELSYCYKSRYEQLQKVEDLDMSIQLIHEHMKMCKFCLDWNPECRHVWGNLAGVYGHRYGALSSVDDLQEAIRLYRQCLDSWKSNGGVLLNDKGLWFANLSNVLTQRFTVLGDKQDIDEAIRLDQEAIETFEPSDARHRASLYHLGNSYMIRHSLFGVEEDIDECIKVFERVGVNARANLSSAYDMRFKKQANPDDWIRAKSLAMKELDAHPLGDPRRASTLARVAQLHIMEGAPEYNVEKALKYRLESLKDTSCSARSRLGNTAWMFNNIDVGTLDADLQELFLEVLVTTMRLLPRAASFGMNPSARLDALQREDEVAIQAASQALCLGRLELALEIFEEGRSIFWKQALQLRAPFDDAPEEKRSRLIQLAKELELESLRPDQPTKVEMDGHVAYMRRLDKQFSEAIEEARSVHGFERFMMGEASSTLVRAAEKGTVVLLIATKASCDAILIKQHGDVERVKLSVSKEQVEYAGQLLKSVSERARDALSKPAELEMDESSASSLNAEILELHHWLEERVDAKVYNNHHARAVGAVGQMSHILTILTFLWVGVVKPIISALKLTQSSGRLRPRIWWCPSGPFSFLPIHAAGIFGGSNLECCAHFMVSSYTPTLKSLLDSRAAFQTLPRSEVRLLLAAVSQAYAGRYLPKTMEEAEVISSKIPPGVMQLFYSQDSDEIGSLEAMLKNLPMATILHLACHGTQNTKNPLNSGFIMRDGLLTISQLMPLSQPRSFMAFLSACETAKGDKMQPDQNVHLAGAMLFSGFKSIVATMWSMDDQDGPTVAKVVYAQLFAGNARFLESDDVPYALDEAVQTLRVNGASPERWATYIHIGI